MKCLKHSRDHIRKFMDVLGGFTINQFLIKKSLPKSNSSPFEFKCTTTETQNLNGMVTYKC